MGNLVQRTCSSNAFTALPLLTGIQPLICATDNVGTSPLKVPPVWIQGAQHQNFTLITAPSGPNDSAKRPSLCISQRDQNSLSLFHICVSSQGLGNKVRNCYFCKMKPKSESKSAFEVVQETLKTVLALWVQCYSYQKLGVFSPLFTVLDCNLAHWFLAFSPIKCTPITYQFYTCILFKHQQFINMKSYTNILALYCFLISSFFLWIFFYLLKLQGLYQGNEVRNFHNF